MEVAAWLKSLGLECYERQFQDNAIDADVLYDLTEADLERMGVLLGHRKRLLKAIAAAREQGIGSSQLQDDQPPRLVAPPSSERRQVAVLFADMVGYTRLSTEMDAEELHTLMGQMFNAIDGVIEAYGGTIDKHIGDCVMGVFGAPVAHDNDPERAARAALDIHTPVAELSDRLDRRLEFRIGIASGGVIAGGTSEAGGRAYTVTGEAANLAARLTELAEPGVTLIADRMHRALGHPAETEFLGHKTVQGFPQPIPIWRLVGLRSRDTSSEHALVGRSAECSQLRSVLDICQQTGVGLVVHVRGEAGIGKTRLMAEFRRLAEEHGFACHTGLIFDFGGKGSDAVRTIVRSLIDVSPAATSSEVSEAVERALAAELVAADHRVFLNDLLDLGQPVEWRALYDAMDTAARDLGRRMTFAELVQALSAAAPRLVIVEDLHWADQAILACLATLASGTAEAPVILAVTSRPDSEPLDAAWRSEAGAATVVTVDLGPLRPAESLELARGILGVVDDRTHFCVGRAQGNPLFLEQLLHNTREGMETDIPDTIQSLVLARVDRLASPDRYAMRVASVLGQQFPMGALRHILADPRYDPGPLFLHHMLRVHDGELLFAHTLIREAIYGALLRDERRGLHRSAAAWFGNKNLTLRAEHLDRAGDMAAPSAYLEAAQAEANAYRHEQALVLVRRGLALASDPGEICALELFHGDVLRHVGSISDSLAAFERAQAVMSDDVGRCRAWIGLAAGMRINDDYEQGHDALNKAEAVAVALELPAELARVHYLRGSLHFPQGNFDDGMREHDLALTYARQTGLPEIEAQALSGLGDAEYGRGRMVSAHDRFRRCVELCRQHGLGRIEVSNIGAAALTRLYLNDVRGAADELLTALDAVLSIGNRRTELWLRLDAALALWEMEESSRAWEQVEQSLSLAQRLGARRFETEGLLLQARLLHGENRRSEALLILGWAMTISRETGIRYLGAVIAGQMAEAADTADVRAAALAEGEAILGAGAVSHNYLWFYRHAIDASLNAANWDQAERYAAALEDYTRAERLPWSDFFVARGRVLASYGRDPHAGLRSELERVREEAERAGLRRALPPLRAILGTNVCP
jgi:class 3 adenylate cyclase/tetratricopeptide (TPR) repeat protein